ncbi:glycine oxidase ThiO [Bosea sp. (in: a-proteobacteria)]|uniref:glycine oxidase ThiO n=1 Tax=Bosea sp. (in: a-proteobacteria) TaxID=1871050 RepID=UPI0011FB7AA7|nr:glycine oxidase ThiO [Bosea sp. (in: a-proteobacteria)]TAJ30081.1 MAG: glycine oxidase ThiO [Bosea sp. (in: a-proteobacteria)]
MSNPSRDARAVIVGAGVVGLACAVELLDRGVSVALHERASSIGGRACSWFAGGMLAPWCEGESAEEPVVRLGQEAAAWWERQTGEVTRQGTLVVAPSRDQPELRRFGQRTDHFEEVDGEAIARLEPDLAGRFSRGLFFAGEAHLDPRRALAALAAKVLAQGGAIHLGSAVEPAELDAETILDCRGLAACEVLPRLRGVRGEMLILKSDEIRLARPVRLLHPRIPLYVVPRADGHFMVGATMIEGGARNRISARSMLELLGAAYALHPAFAEAEIVETGTDARPAFPDNLPRLVRKGRVLHVNGLYRHGFLLSPAMARMAADAVLDPLAKPEMLHDLAA